jgi:DNA invertase Pin-like site-specific DNA recombinase
MRLIFHGSAEKKRRLIDERTKVALATVRKRGIKLGGRNEQSDRNAAVAAERAEALRTVFGELKEWSANACAAELNAQGVPAPGGRWFAVQVIRVRERL